MIPPHICSTIKTNQVGKQDVGMWRIQKRFPQYGVPIWSLWPNIRFLASIVAEKNATKNILGRTEGRTEIEIKQYTPPPLFVKESEQNEQSQQRTFHRCFLPSFSTFGQTVSEEKNLKHQPIWNKNRLWRPYLLMDRDRMKIIYRGPSIDASYQVSDHLFK